MANPTKLIYQQDGERLLHNSRIISILPFSDLTPPDQSLAKGLSEIEHAVVTDSTIFYVQGGGQPADIGIMKSESEVPAQSNSRFEVKSVRQPTQGNQILHLGRFITSQSQGDNGPQLVFAAGDQIQQEVDSETRNLHSRLHTAGHVMSLAIHALCREGALPPLKESKASHYPDSAGVVFEGTIDGKFKDAIQAKTDEFVRSARPVKIHWWSMDELREKCYGVTEAFELPEGEVMGRVVEMEGLGSYPCGGTHVKDCSQVGKIVVKKISRSKGTSKVSYTVE